MPLTKRQFQLRIDEEMENWMRLVYHLLAGHRELAYSYDELQSTVLHRPASPPVESKFKRAVDTLVGIGALDKRDVNGTDYYAFLTTFDTQSWEMK